MPKTRHLELKALLIIYLYPIETVLQNGSMKREKHKLLLFYSTLLELVFYSLKAFKAVFIQMDN